MTINQDSLTTRKTRFHYWDTWKGIGVLAVIAIQATNSTSFFPQDSFNWQFGIVLRQFINFPIAIFLFISGYFAASNSINSIGESLSFWGKRFVKILPPYIFWSLIYILLEKPSHFASINAISQDFLLGTGIGIGYFIIVLIQFIILTPIIVRIKSDTSNIASMIVISSIGMIATYVVEVIYFDTEFAHFPFYLLPFYAWYPFYHLGIWIKKKGFTDRTLDLDLTMKFLLFYIVFLIASVAEAWILSKQGLYSFAISQIKLSSFFCSLFLCLTMVAFYTKNADFGLFSWLGKYYYAIYMMHLLFLPLFENLIKDNFIGLYNNQPLTTLLEVILVLITCSSVIGLLNRFLPESLSAKFIGK